jgi:hypothetical protein
MMRHSPESGPAGDETEETVELRALRQTPKPPEPTTSALAAIAWPLSDPQRGITRRLVPRFRHAAHPSYELTSTAPQRAVRVARAAPTVRRQEPLHFCYQCGAGVPPWRDACFHHDRRHGQGMPRVARLTSLDGAAGRPTLKLRTVRRRAAA